MRCLEFKWHFPELNFLLHPCSKVPTFLLSPVDPEFPPLRGLWWAVCLPQNSPKTGLLLNYMNTPKESDLGIAPKAGYFPFIPHWVRKMYSFTSQKINLMHVPQEIHVLYLFMAKCHMCIRKEYLVMWPTATSAWATIHSELVR